MSRLRISLVLLVAGCATLPRRPIEGTAACGVGEADEARALWQSRPEGNYPPAAAGLDAVELQLLREQALYPCVTAYRSELPPWEIQILFRSEVTAAGEPKVCIAESNSENSDYLGCVAVAMRTLIADGPKSAWVASFLFTSQVGAIDLSAPPPSTDERLEPRRGFGADVPPPLPR